MEYRVLITSDAEADLDAFIKYLLVEKKSEQAGDTVIVDNIFHELQDYENTMM